MSQGEFLTPAEMRGQYDPAVEAYRSAFGKSSIWREESQCAADEADPVRCEGGFSPQSIGEMCLRCGNCLVEPAYPRDELIQRFETIAATRPTSWYVEQDEQGRLAMAAVGWQADAATIAAEKYGDVPAMRLWLQDNINGTVMWLDEVFANRAIRPSGNLQNFGIFVAGLARQLGVTTVAYRTIEPKMTAAAVKSFGARAQVFPRSQAAPDRRDFVLIDLSEEGQK